MTAPYGPVAVNDRRASAGDELMTARSDKVRQFRDLHRAGCFTVPNPWDIAGAQMMTALGFKALATTSSGYAFSKGKKDGSGDVSRDESLQYAAAIAASTHLPVTADTEDAYAETPDGVGETVRMAAEMGLAGLSIEDRQPNAAKPIRDFDDAVARVTVAVQAARRYGIVLTVRADGLGAGAYGLDEAIRRLKAFEAVGADVLYVPAVPDVSALQQVCRSVNSPINHVIGLGVSGLGFQQIADAGVRRISLGGSLARTMGGVLLQTCQAIAQGDFSDLYRGASWQSIRDPKPALQAKA
jgi:2-methylisocitrate lyase-like PEP mutase family enzyme